MLNKSCKRKTLKLLLGSTLAGTAALSPDKWLKPIVSSVSLPAHAGTTNPMESATVELMNSGGTVIPNGTEVIIGDTVSGIFTITPNPGAGVNYTVKLFRNGVENDSAQRPTDASGKIVLIGAVGSGAVSGDTEEVCLTLNGNPKYVCADWKVVHPASDVNIKENILPVDQQVILEQLIDTPISYWNYQKDVESTRHIGPMAQDVSSIFDVGDSDKHIHLIDGQGIALASIQALHKLIEAQNEQIEMLKQELVSLKARE